MRIHKSNFFHNTHVDEKNNYTLNASCASSYYGVQLYVHMQKHEISSIRHLFILVQAMAKFIPAVLLYLTSV